ncbi:MAG TPA: potassium channel family protein [Terriglobales bacterium]|nr:potassium channel family protein [Terriglobales bacterium]
MGLAFIGGVVLNAVVLWDAFETVILPRRVSRRFRLTRLFYRTSWHIWFALAALAPRRRRETLLSFFGPLSLLVLFALWAVGLILGFGLVQWALKSSLNPGSETFSTYLYLSGSTFFTLGFGDVVPLDATGRTLAVLESGTGFGFLALVLGYLPVLYGAFSRREVNISLLDARAGSPPTAAELLRRHREDHEEEELRRLLHEWERWSAELMESHLSYPVLAYFRSQHDNQSWLAALTAILDASALVMVWETGSLERQARLTFAMARHAVVDLAQVFATAPQQLSSSRLTQEDWERLRQLLGWTEEAAGRRRPTLDDLARLHAMYEPYVTALAGYLRLSLPPWAPPPAKKDNWQTSAWERSAPSPRSCAPPDDDEHA